MIRPLLPALALLTLSLAACGQQTPAAQTPVAQTPVAQTPAAQIPTATQAGVTLSIPAPSGLNGGLSGGLSAQYVNRARTTRVDVGLDGAAATPYTLGSALAPCGPAVCTISLGFLSPGSHTFLVSSYGVNPGNGQTVMVSQGSATQTLTAGQTTDITLTLAPVGTTLALNSEVKQYDPATRAFGNYVSFAALGGRSLPAYYDLQTLDSVGDPLPQSAALDVTLCGNNSEVAISNISDAAHLNRYRVEVQALGAHSLSVQAGATCTVGAPALVSLNVTGTPTSSPKTLAGGNNHSLAVLTDGTVRAWGYNASGQLGDGTLTSSPVPVTVGGLSGVVSVSGGSSHSLALLNDGTLRAWGTNTNGQLGDGTTRDRSTPGVVAGLNTVVSVSASNNHNLALLADGTVRTWGANASGQLGDGSTTDRSTPVAVRGLQDVVSVSGGGSHALAVLADGTVRAWGADNYGQLGDGSVTNSPVTAPVTVGGLSNVANLSGGNLHSVAVLGDGTVRTWGYNIAGQLGNGNTSNSAVPVAVSSLTGAVRVSSGANHSLVAMADGTVRAWGYNGFGQLGDGTGSNRKLSVAVSNLGGVIRVSSGSNYSMAVLTDGTVRAWGYNVFGQFGDGSTTSSATPVTITGLSGVAQPAP